MAVPDFQAFLLPMLQAAADGKEHRVRDLGEAAMERLGLSAADRAERLESGQARAVNRAAWAAVYLRKAGLLAKAGRGSVRITDRGREALATAPAAMDHAYLKERYPEVRAIFTDGGGTDAPAEFDPEGDDWKLRPAVQARVRSTFEKGLRDADVRRGALRVLAFAISNADEERAGAWYVKATRRGARLMAGRLLACEIRRSKVRLAVMGPVSDTARAAIGAKLDEDSEFKWVPGSLLVTFPADRADAALSHLRDAYDEFVDAAMARVRRAVALEDHAPEVVAYIASELEIELPQPRPDRDDEGGGSDDDEDAREPRRRGRAPIFEPGQRSISSLLADIDPARGVIALPDLQRPFVWEDTRVRDLLDSLFLGFPVGTLVLWHTSTEKEARAIGAPTAGLRATTLVIDGQQRLSSLYAVWRGEEITGKDGERRRIVIAFRPRDGRFEVADAAVRKDPEFLPDITELWRGPKTKRQIRKDMITRLESHGRTLDEHYEEAVEHNLERLHSLNDYSLPTVEIRGAASGEQEATEEDVAEIFVRINNQGARLGQADFVLTLLSVFHGPLRDRIEARARLLANDPLVSLDTQQLLRAACAVAFGRARMRAIYRSLRGIDPDTGAADPESRTTRLASLDQAAHEVVQPTAWMDYTLRVRHAGFVAAGLIASKNAIVNAFAFYIRGRRLHVPKGELDAVISRWVFATLLTARYSGSSETAFEQDLSRTEGVDAEGFVRALEDEMAETLAGDYWTRSLVVALETPKGRAPAALAFRAAQVVLGARALFSDQLLHNLLAPGAEGGRAAAERHHLFPEAFLARKKADRRLIRQVANLADTGWYENSSIGARSPADYVGRVRNKLEISDDRWARMCAEHALPASWETMQYETFLVERRRRMAELIRAAFRVLGGEADLDLVAPPWFLAGTQVVWERIAETERSLRKLVREVYNERFPDDPAAKIEAALPAPAREVLARAARARPSGADPLSVVDYLYLAQLPALLYNNEAWPIARQRLGGGNDAKGKLEHAVQQIVPVRNEIAHVREVSEERLRRAVVACDDVKALVSAAR